MIQINKKDIISLYKQGKVIQATYKGGYLLWQAIRSCFGSGFWVNQKPWIDEEIWKNN
jgi:hypothetical protein